MLLKKTQEHAENIPEAEERWRTFILDTAQNHGNNFNLFLD